MDQTGDILKNDCIEECKIPWGSQILLAAKPHQERIEYIEDLFGACVYCIVASIKSLYILSIQYLNVMTPYFLLQ